jgi:hypothetical protein
MAEGIRVSYGDYVFQHVVDWAPLPDGWEWNHVVGVGVNSKDEIFAYNRSDHPMIVLNPEAEILRDVGRGSIRHRSPPVHRS